MATTFVLNRSQSIEDPTGVYPQAQISATDFEILRAAAGGRNGVSSGCLVTAQGSPNTTVAVSSGTVVVAGVEIAVASGNVTMTAAHATLPRKDLITVNSSGTKAYTAGTAAAAPVMPAIPANSVVLACIYVAANDNVINSAQIVDKWVTVPTPASGAGWTTVSAAADVTKTTDNALANDATLVFTMAASTKYRIRGAIFIDAAAACDWKYAFTGPASPTMVRFERVDGTGTLTAPSETVIDTAYPGSTSMATSSANGGFLRFDAIVHNGSNAGTFAFQWAQDTSDASSAIRRAGSYLEYSVA